MNSSLPIASCGVSSGVRLKTTREATGTWRPPTDPLTTGLVDSCKKGVVMWRWASEDWFWRISDRNGDPKDEKKEGLWVDGEWGIGDIDL